LSELSSETSLKPLFLINLFPFFKLQEVVLKDLLIVSHLSNITS
jgi:hypothetical protein